MAEVVPSAADPQRARNGAMYERTAILLQSAGIARLQAANVFLAGVGGVGGHCAEALVRAGVGAITLVDHDVVTATNKNRQLIALDSTVGQCKVDELAGRLADVNAACVVTAIDGFVLPEDVVAMLTRQRYDAVVDCIDSVECKVALLAGAAALGIPAFASGGAGGRLAPELVRTGDVLETENDALMRACRGQLKKRGVRPGQVACVYSTEKALPPLPPSKQDAGGRDRSINGTISYMPPLFGLQLASMAIRHLLDPEAAAEAQRRKAKKAEQLEKRKSFAAEAKRQAAAAAVEGGQQTKGRNGRKRPEREAV